MSAAVLAAAITLTPMTAATSAAHVPTSQQAFANCVSTRESHGNYKAKGDESSARGRWQFLDLKWRHGLSYMVRDRLVHFGMSKHMADRVRIHLQSKPIDKWEPVLQDVAFMAVLNARGKWSGWRHWYISGSRCNALAGE